MTEPTVGLDEIMERLGPTADDIAVYLLSAGITGKPGEPGCCPIANYLCGLGFEEVGVWIKDEGYVEIETSEDCVRAAGHVEQFVADFDRGLWPNLIDVDF